MQISRGTVTLTEGDVEELATFGQIEAVGTLDSDDGSALHITIVIEEE